jgi:TolB protein
MPPLPKPTPLGGSGQVLFASTRGGSYDDLYFVDLGSTQVTRLTQGASNTFLGPLSPDGRQIAFAGFGLTHSSEGVMSNNGGYLLNLTNAEFDEDFPAWSPDGQQIAFASDPENRTSVYSIYVMIADGSEVKRLTSTGSDYTPAWALLCSGTML